MLPSDVRLVVPHEKPSLLLEKAAALRDQATRAARLAAGLLAGADQARLTQYGDALRKEAEELERQAAAEVPSRPAEQSRDATKDRRNPNKGRGGCNDPDPQT